MSEKEFKYADPKFLNKLAICISGERCELTANLRPDIPEFIKAVCNSDRSINYDLRTAAIRVLCETHKIMPFWYLVFWEDYCPKIEYYGPDLTHSSYADKFRESSSHPAYFAMSRRWFGINFRDIKGAKGVRQTQQAIAEFVKNEYIVTSIEANLDPHIRTADHYCDYKESRATLWASNGEVTVSGNIPEDFDIKDLMQKELPAVALPPLGLEGLV